MNLKLTLSGRLGWTQVEKMGKVFRIPSQEWRVQEFWKHEKSMSEWSKETLDPLPQTSLPQALSSPGLSP